MATNPSTDLRIYEINVTDTAYNDLRAIYDFIKKNTETDYYAIRQVDALESAILNLAIFPNGYPKYNDTLPCRIRHFKKYCIIFEADDATRSVNILRIFHARRNIEFGS